MSFETDESPWWQALADVRADVTDEARWEALELLRVEQARTAIVDRIVVGASLWLADGQHLRVSGVEEILDAGVILMAGEVRPRSYLVPVSAIDHGIGLARRLPDENREYRTLTSALREHAGEQVEVTWARGQRARGRLDFVGADHLDVGAMDAGPATTIALTSLVMVALLDQ